MYNFGTGYDKYKGIGKELYLEFKKDGSYTPKIYEIWYENYETV